MAERTTAAPSAARPTRHRPRPLGFAGASLRPLWRNRPAAIVQTIGLVAALALGLLVPLVQAMSAEAGLRAAVTAMGDGANIEIQRIDIRSSPAFDAYLASSATQVRQAMGGAVEPGVRFASTDPLIPRSIDGVSQSGPFDYLPFASTYPDLAAHAQVVAGALPAGPGGAEPYPAAITETAAKRLDVGLNGVYCAQANVPPQFVQTQRQFFCAKVVAIWRPVDPTSTYWDGRLPNQDLVLAADDFFAAGRSLRAVALRSTVTFSPRIDRLGATGAPDLIQRVNHLRGVYAVANDAIFFTGFDRALDGFLHRLQAADYAARLVGAAILGLAVFSLVFLTDHFLRAEREDVSLWLIRGWPWARAWLALVAQQALLALIAVPIAVLLVAAVLAAIGSALFKGAVTLTGTDLAALAPGLALTAALGALVLALTALVFTHSAVPAARPLPVPAWWRRTGVVQAILALIGIALLADARLNLATGGARTGDALSVAAPGMALVLLAVAALRLLPAIASAAARGERLPALLAAWQIGRRSAQYSQLALLLTFAVAIGLFASAFVATDQRNAADRAAYASGADFRAEFSRGLVPADLDAQALQLKGVTASSPATRVTGRPGRTMDFDSTLLGVDPSSFWSVAWTRSDLDAGREPALTTELARRDPDGVPLQGGGDLTVWAYGTAPGAALSAQLADAAGQPAACDLGTVPTGAGVQLRCSLPPASNGPWRLRSLTVRSTQAQPAAGGRLYLSDLMTSGAMIESFVAANGWWSQLVATQTRAEPILPTWDMSHDANSTGAVPLRLDQAPTRIYPPPSDKPLPALVSTQTMDRLGLKLGQAFPIHLDTIDLQILPVATVDYWPTLYPGTDLFMVLDQTSMLERLGAQSAISPWANELWLKTSSSPLAIRQELAARFSTSVVGTDDRAGDQAAALGDPLRLSLDAELVGGFLAAVALVVIGFGLHFLAVARGRQSEYAIMRANGLHHGTVGSSLLAEQVLVLAFGLLLGAVLGAAAALTVLPVLAPSSLPQDLIPPAWVDLAPAPAAAVLTLLAALCLLVGRFGVRAGGRFDLVAELRSLS